MLIDINKSLLKYNIEPKGIIHIGIHEGQEIPEYVNICKFDKILCFDANQTYIDMLRRMYNSNIRFECCAVTDYNGTIKFNVTNNGQSSSVLPLKRHSDIYPNIHYVEERMVEARTINSYKLDGYNVMNLDIQGNELKALKGSTDILDNIDMIYTEINLDELYEGCCLKHEIDQFLSQYGFECVDTYLAHPTWGDAIYVRGK